MTISKIFSKTLFSTAFLASSLFVNNLTYASALQIDRDVVRSPIHALKTEKLYSDIEGKSALILAKASFGLHTVYANDKKLGEFNEVDLLLSDPFVDGENWAFRAKKDDKAFLFVNGEMFGPFLDVWTPAWSADHSNWGTLARTDLGYVLIVDGVQSAPYDNFIGYADEFDYSSRVMTPVPYYYGDSKYLAAFSNQSEASLITETGSYHGYARIAMYELGGDTQSVDDYSAFITADGKHAGLPVSRIEEDGSLRHSLFFEGEEHGSFSAPADNERFFFAKKHMSYDGSNWIVLNESAVYTKNQSYEVEASPGTSLSVNGKGYAFSYYDAEQNRYLQFNDRRFGPYVSVGRTEVNASGDNFLAEVNEGNGNYVIDAENTKLGPFKQSIVSYQQDIPVVYGLLESGGVDIYVNNEFIGHYSDASIPVISTNSFVLPNFSTFGIDGSYKVLIGDVVNDVLGSFSLVTNARLSSDWKSWSGVAKSESGLWHVIERGEVSPEISLLSKVNRVHRSKNGATVLLTGRESRTENYVLGREQRYGPYAKRISLVKISDDGKVWAFLGKQSESNIDVVTANGTFGPYSRVSDFNLSEDGQWLTFIAHENNQQYAVINGEKFGPFKIAAISHSSDNKITVSGQRAYARWIMNLHR